VKSLGCENSTAQQSPAQFGDAHYGTGTSHGDSMFENGGFIVHFFDRALVDRLATGFTLLDLSAFEEGSLPRRLWRIRAGARSP
jgi:hypothetical protein